MIASGSVVGCRGYYGRVGGVGMELDTGGGCSGDRGFQARGADSESGLGVADRLLLAKADAQGLCRESRVPRGGFRPGSRRWGNIG